MKTITSSATSLFRCVWSMAASGCILEDPIRPCTTYGMTILQPDRCCSSICVTVIFVQAEHGKETCLSQPKGSLKLMIHLLTFDVTMDS